ncbi:class I SAM-dependent DNA methyltransferase [Anatilimnocola sp. NA78]|uniref:HsdM family class I SAM-dependent methyltransferase n=1 Tax=Anatilimnocola sp. NA78 TaxID=3415683 RepID=UPI003CE50229
MPRPFSAPEHEPALSRADRRARGVFYTPVEVAEWITQAAYGPLVRVWNGESSPPRMIDPACGGGVFLAAAARLLRERCAQLGWSEAQTRKACRGAIFGTDIDPAAVQTAAQQLPELGGNLRCADSLADSSRAQFEVVLGNPPYVSIRELARTHSAAQVHSLRDRYETATGNFDLYVLFIERALELLKPNGRLGFIVPNKWATLDYAARLREMLLQQTTLEQVVDLSNLRVFPQASTYPQVLVLRKSPAPSNHAVHVSEVCHSLESPLSERLILQETLASRAFVFGSDLAVEGRVSTAPLENVCTLHSGASGYAAEKLSAEIGEREGDTLQRGAVDFIVSGNIDRYSLELGDVRFLKQHWNRPCLRLDSPQLSPQKQQLYREPKLVFSGMSRRLKCAYDDQGCALGVQVYAANNLQQDPFYLLGLLNSKLLSYLFRERFAAKRLAGGYSSINKGQLAQLPIRLIAPQEKWALQAQRKIASLAKQLHSQCTADLDEQLDALVYDLYAVTTAERQLVEAALRDQASPAPAKRRVA